MLDAYPPDIRDFVLQKVASGEFKSADEFAVEAARAYRDRDLRQKELKRLVDEGVADIESGNYIVLKNKEELHEFFETIKREGRERLGIPVNET